ncbi:phosphoribosylamine--glycine ligase [Oribacterium sp. oral taxon 102]|uniref:phosphoribosylamine--glycine ligase n=1 Tax=Oribacterium sp. oral taxon 102 TaxID=671214 RepID=UPI0015BD262D|nr:phosphoribosylamine--glycine ligase [Oribacterium sp. oral taxon 102]NWO22105.1 phosphoribosylamine--glycine ligase [Oribacterium sp. oral taxon 102]
MKIAVIGGGGREHAILRALKKNRSVETVYAIPGNGGMAEEAVCVPEYRASDVEGIVRFCRERAVNYVVVAPDDPLVLGMVDALEEAGIPAFGPRKDAAILEGSKVFSKNLMKKYGIPTAAYEAFTELDAALRYASHCPIPAVIKADGLALGKGVIIAMTRSEAVEGVRTIMAEKKFGHSGDRIVIEEYLEGPEVSVLSFTDGTELVPMVSSMDHKRALDGDQGLNTGGMGTVAPNPFYTEEVAKECMERIFLPTVRAMNAEGRSFRGCLYFGLMLTKDGPKVIEYNCRFGDPETQVVLPLLDSDLLTILRACTEGRLAGTEIRWKSESACCIVAASGGYPQAYRSGYEISGLSGCENVYIAGAERKDGKLLTSGGRVLGVVRTAETLERAIKLAYEDMERIHFTDMHYRRDIGQRALRAGRGE